ncbi:MAG: GNAT family N-acetyltransferase [Deltaproteobacteria bacterium]|nr:GNAT family N-acetyltransferase [Deltaproteobacteria bacterium]MBI3390720.1 GNAT family N-acetyltransferase [Deltaproteobacteria bacterium]
MHAAVARGKRVLLRLPSAHDCDEFVALMRASRRLHHPWAAPATTTDAFADYLNRIRRKETYGLLACERSNGAIVGVFNFNQIVRGHYHSTYLGYFGGAPFARQGYMTEGLALVLRYAFTKLKLHRLEANIQPGNRASLALARRCGLRCEGFSPRYLKVNGRWRDHERWAITVEDWRRLRAEERR